MFQFLVLSIIIGGVVSIIIDTDCKQYTKQNYTEDISGYIGEQFLILVDADKNLLYYQSVCLNEHAPQMRIVTSSKGIIKNDSEFSFVDILKISSEHFGTAILMFTESVELISRIYGNFLPLERLGTEYFILLPNKQVNEPLAHICTLNTDTTVALEMRHNGLKKENSSLVRHLGRHEIWTVGRTFDFSGSRVLSTERVAIFADFSTELGTSQKTQAYQFLPSYVFGKQYGVINDMLAFWNFEREVIVIVRLLAMFDETDIWTASDSVNTVGSMMLRGELRELDITSKRALTLLSEKRFIVIQFSERNELTSTYIVPVGQFVNGLIGYVGDEKNVTLFYKMLAGQTADINVELLDFFTGKPLYALHNHMLFLNDTVLCYGLLQLNITRHWFYIYLRSRTLLGLTISWIASETVFNSYTETWSFHRTFKDCKLVNQTCGEDCHLADSCELSNSIKANRVDNVKSGVLIGSIIISCIALSIAGLLGKKIYRTNKRNKLVRPERTTNGTTPV